MLGSRIWGDEGRAPFLAGSLNAGGFWYAAEVSRLRRYRVVAIVSVVLGAAVSLASDGATYQPVATYFAVMGGLLAVLGVTLLVRFLVRSPKPQSRPSVDR